MKKMLLVLLVMAAVVSMGVFADDAKVLPAGVFRTYLVPSFVFGSEQYNSNGDKVDATYGNYTFFNLGAAAEYGVNDWVTVALQWAPGSNLYSKFDDNDYMTANGAFELFAGAKFQLVGSKGLSKNNTIRIAVAPGIMVPMAFSYDAEQEANNATATAIYEGSGGLAGALTDYNVAPAKNAFGIGGRVYGDYIVNKMFFVNLYGEYIQYFDKDASDDFVALTTAAKSGVSYDTVNYGYKLTSEVEFHFSKPLSQGMSFSAGLPFTYTYSPDYSYDGTTVPDTASYTVSINPNASIFVTSLPLPLEFKLSYKLPLAGENSLASNVITAQIKAYMKF